MSVDDHAKAKRVEGHLRLVVSIAKTHSKPPGCSFLDLVDAGNVGLMKAVDSYEDAPEREPRETMGETQTYLDMMDGSVVEADERFEAYAAPFIHAEMKRAVENGTLSAADRETLDRLRDLRSLLSSE